MGALRQIRRSAAAILLSLAVVSCRDAAEPTGTGRTAPTAAALAVAPVFGGEAGDPVIPLRQARIRLFRLPGRTPEVAAVDTLIPFGDEEEQAVTLAVTLTMASERFGMELALLDDRGEVAYLGRDTVTAHTRGRPPAATPFRLVYSGPDTAVARIAVAPRDTVLAIGDALPLRVSAFLRDGRSTTARFGFAVHGSSAITVDAQGVVRALTPVSPRTAWVVARTATGLTDSVAVGAIVPARSISLSPVDGRLIVGTTMMLTAVASDSSGSVLVDREVVWRSADPGVATVAAGKVTGVGVGTTEITATSERATATAVITVLPGGAVRVAIAPRGGSLRVGETLALSAVAFDASGGVVPASAIFWRSLSPDLASVDAGGVVRALAHGHVQIVATVDGVSDSVQVDVLP